MTHKAELMVKKDGWPADEKTTRNCYNCLTPTIGAKREAEMDKYEEIARQYIEGVGGLFDLYRYEHASPLCRPKEVEGARWMLLCLTNPQHRKLLDELVTQSDLLRQKFPRA